MNRFVRQRALWLLVFSVLPAAAQVTGRISGSVVDSTGAAIPGATVHLYLKGAASPAFTTTTGQEGSWFITAIRPETYDITVEATGFAKQAIREMVISAGRELSLPAIKMEVGSIAETVEVSAVTTSVQTTNAEVSTTVSNEQVRLLPLINRSPLALITTQAGVTANGRENTTINGQRVSFTNVTLDGINIQDNYIRTNALDFLPNMLLLDQVAEITIATSNANAAVGGGSSQVIFVTPSGTNEYHGSLYWSNRNNALAANTWFNNRDGIKRPFLNQNQIGGVFRGRIIRDKLFFFVNYEAFRLRQQSTANRTILTEDARKGIYTYRDSGGTVRKVNVLQAAGVPADPTVQQMLAQVPGPEKINNSRVGDSSESLPRNTGGYSFLLRNNRTRNNYTFKGDYVASTKHVFSGSYVHNTDYSDRTDLANEYSSIPKVFNDNPTRLLSLTYRWSPLPNLTNEARGGFNIAPGLFLSNEKFPKNLFGGLLFSNPVNTFMPQGRYTDTFNATDNATWVRGKHTIQFGFQLQAVRSDPYNDAGIVPTYTLGLGIGNPVSLAPQLPGIGSTDRTGAENLLANLAGYLTSYTQTFNVKDRTSGFVSGTTSLRRMAFDNYAGYLTDSWKVAPRLTLTATLRYDYFTVVDERQGLVLLPQLLNGNPIHSLMTNNTLDFAGKVVGRPFYNPDRNNFAPHLGLAWDVFGNGKTSLRAGYGLSYVNDDAIQTIRNNVTTSTGLSANSARVGLGGRISAGLPAIPTPAYKVPRTFSDNYANDASSAFGLPDPGLRTPYVQQWSFGIQQEVKGAVIEVRYVGNHGTKLFRGFDYNQVVIKENGFLEDFRRALNNGNLARAAGKGFLPAYDASIPGSQRLPVFDRVVDGGRLTNATVINYIQTQQAGELASYYQTSRLNGGVNFFRNPYALGANVISNYSNSTYNGLQMDVRKRVRGNLQFQANYTFSKALSDAQGNGQTRFEPFLDMDNPKVERAREPFDVTHAIKANWSYELPLGQGKRWDYRPLRKLLGGWTLSGYMTKQSGNPFSILSDRGTINRAGRSAGANTANTNLTKSQLDEVVTLRMTGNGPYFIAASAINPTDNRGFAPDGTAPFQGQVFFQPEAGNIGSLQRRMFSGPWWFDLAFSAVKTTKITERQSVELRMESTNFFNHPTWYVGDYTLSSTQFGRITTTQTGRRLIQFALRYNF